MSKPSTPSIDREEPRGWHRLVRGVLGGKVVGDARYLHVSSVPAKALAVLHAEVAKLGGPREGFNVVKLVSDSARFSLLNYPAFFEQAFPPLADAWTLDLAEKRCEHRAYPSERNPPVLHRKELLLAPDHPRRAEYEALTAEAERMGLFADTAIIGHRDQWEEIVRSRGLRVEGHSFVTIDDVSEGAPASATVQRHRTAMARKGLSTPMQALWRHGYIAAPLTVFDYGCGRGDDLEALEACGVSARGWDPFFRPNSPRDQADVVNLGFVLNVIEDADERKRALSRAYGLARKVLAVSALLGGRSAIERHRAYRDGVLTTRNTFQKYFEHGELGEYVSEVLGRDPVSIGPGLFFVFRSDEDEQEFLERRQRSSGSYGAMPAAPGVTAAPRDAGRVAKQPRVTKSKAANKWESNAPLVEAFWQSCVELGRCPREGEFEGLAEMIREVASAPVVLRRMIDQRGAEALERTRERRMGDLSVFLALNLFDHRRSEAALPERTRADLKEFWGSHIRATEAAQGLLFSLRDPKLIEARCAWAAERGLGFLVPGESLQLDARLVNELPPALRVYVGCAGKLYGEAQDADMVKIHIASGKVSLMRYEDYDGSAIPLLLERVKVDLRRQQVGYYQYGEEFAPQPLYLKSRYLHPAMEGYAAQKAFDAALLALPQFDPTGYGTPLGEMGDALDALVPPPGMRRLSPRG